MKSVFRRGLCGPSAPTDCACDDSDDDTTSHASPAEHYLPLHTTSDHSRASVAPAGVEQLPSRSGSVRSRNIARHSPNPSHRSRNPSQRSRNPSQRSRNPSLKSRNPSQRSRQSSLRSKAGSFRASIAASLTRSSSKAKTPNSLDVLPCAVNTASASRTNAHAPSVTIVKVAAQLQKDLMPSSSTAHVRYGFLHRHFTRRRRSR